MALPSYEEFHSRRSFGSLDGIRCLSITGVVWHHTIGRSFELSASTRGYLGVDMFFVLSGFLIVTLLLRERDRTGTISLPKFYLRRSLRIFPLYYGLLAATTLAVELLSRHGNFARPFLRELPFLATYTSNWVALDSLFAISWSLAAEEQFYLLWPPIERHAARFALPVLAAIVAVNQLVNFHALAPQTLAAVGLNPDLPMLQATFTPICLGVALAHLLHSRRGFGIAGRSLSSAWASPAALALVVALASLPPADISGWSRLLIQMSMALFLCSCVVTEDHGLRVPLQFPPLARVGVVSYGVYLFHPFALHAAELLLRRDLPGRPIVLFATCLVLAIAVAELSYRYYEAPFLRMKDWLQLHADRPPR